MVRRLLARPQWRAPSPKNSARRSSIPALSIARSHWRRFAREYRPPMGPRWHRSRKRSKSTSQIRVPCRSTVRMSPTELRTPQVDRWVSEVSAHPAVRAALLPVQRSIASGRPVVMVGRDIATIVIPEAGLKVYLDASVDERARRRFAELERAGAAVSFDDVRSELERRDLHDSSRTTSPLKLHEDALVVHTDALTIEEVAGAIVEAYHERSAPQQPVLVQAQFTVKTRPEFFAQSARRRKRGKLAYWAIWPWLHRVSPYHSGRGRQHPALWAVALCFESPAQSRSRASSSIPSPAR